VVSAGNKRSPKSTATFDGLWKCRPSMRATCFESSPTVAASGSTQGLSERSMMQTAKGATRLGTLKGCHAPSRTRKATLSTIAPQTTAAAISAQVTPIWRNSFPQSKKTI